MGICLVFVAPLLLGYFLDLIFGDPYRLPHPIRFFGSAIHRAEKWLNKGACRFIKGMLMALILCIGVYLFFLVTAHFLYVFNPYVYILFCTIFVFYGLANKSLITEGQKVFEELSKGIEAGRKQLSWIVGRDTSNLTEQQIRKAVFETMSENLSDGVIAPLFYYLIAGIPGMMTYKMINTLDSMVGYRNDRYELFGKFSARLDDIANFIPSRLTALLMIMINGSWRGLQFIIRYGNKHKSPNSGYPESALAGIIDVQFGGPNWYHGVLIDKPYIGLNNRAIKQDEIRKVSRINHFTCLLMVALIIIIKIIYYCI